VIIAGPPASGKTTLCKAVSEHFNIPLLQMSIDDSDSTRKQLCSEVCRYRGYVLNAGLAGWTEVEELFCKDYELPVDPEEEEAAPPQETEDGEAPPVVEKKFERRLSDEGIVPQFVVLMQAPEALCRARHKAGDKGKFPEKLQQDVAQFAARNLVDGQPNIADFFQDTAKIGVFNLPVAGKSEEDMFESTRIYMESGQGRPFNYLTSADEVAEQLLTKQREREEIVAMKAEVAERQVSQKVVNEAVCKRHLDRLRIIGTHEAEQNQLAGLSLREYLMRYMVPNLTEGLIEMCMVLPDNPVDYLANYLEQHAANEQSEN